MIGRAFVIVWPLDRTAVLRSPATFNQPGLGRVRRVSDGPAVVGSAAMSAEVPARSRAMPRFVVRREGGLYAYEKALRAAGLTPVAGADEAGRGACAGPLVVAAVVLPDGRRGQVPGLADSKLLTAAARERVYDEVVARAAATLGRW